MLAGQKEDLLLKSLPILPSFTDFSRALNGRQDVFLRFLCEDGLPAF